jgi:hypothetical protein
MAFKMKRDECSELRSIRYRFPKSIDYVKNCPDMHPITVLLIFSYSRNSYTFVKYEVSGI